MSLGVDPSRFVTDSERPLAISSLRHYFSGHYTGALFEKLTDREEPNAITARDIVAVTALGVRVPVRAADWILGAGRAEISDLLSMIPNGVPIWENVRLDLSSKAWELWTVLDAQYKVGATITSKLLAAKRPHLLPIWDQYVVDGVQPKKNEYWVGWQEALSGESGAELRAVCEAIRQEADAPDCLSVLRILDIVIWMRVHGYDWLDEPADKAPYLEAKPFWGNVSS